MNVMTGSSRDARAPTHHRLGGVVWRSAPGVLAAAMVVVLAWPRLGRRAFWLDEAFTVGATHDLLATWRGTGGTMSLYYLLMWPVTQLSIDRDWVRLPSLIFAAATVVVVHQIGRRLADGRLAATSALVLALMWAISRFAIEARSYTLALLLVSLSWLGLIGAVQADAANGAGRIEGTDRAGPDGAGPGGAGAGGWWWRLFVVATLLAPLAHGLAALHFVTQVGLLAVLPNRWRWWRACAPVAVLLAGEGVLLFSLGAGEVAGWIEPLNLGQVLSLLHLLLGRDPQLEVLGALVVVAGALVLREARRLGSSTEAWLALVPVVWAAGMPLLLVVVSLARPYAEPRYVIGALPGVALLVSNLVVRVRPAALGVAFGLSIAVLLALDQPRITPNGSENWPSLVRRITIDGHDGDRLLAPAMLRSPFDYAWAEGADRPDLTPLSPTDLIGEVRRFYDAAPGGLRAQVLVDPTATVWYVDRDHRRLDEVAELLADPAVARFYDLTGRWTFGGELYLLRLEPAPATPIKTAGP